MDTPRLGGCVQRTCIEKMALVIIVEHIKNTALHVNKAAGKLARAFPVLFQPAENPTSLDE